MNYIDYMNFDGNTYEDLLYYLKAICRITDGQIQSFYEKNTSFYITLENRECKLDVDNLECVASIICYASKGILQIEYYGIFRVIRVRKKT